MRKFILLAVAAVTLMASDCNHDAPDQTDTLNAYFLTDNVWTITGDLIDGGGTATQTWSDAVVIAEALGKTTFNGGDWDGPFYADWFDNPGYGTLFSFEAVKEYQDQLCPGDWCVPSVVDFQFLDRALGGTGTGRQYSQTLVENYLNQWGGTYGGLCYDGEFRLLIEGKSGVYWSSTEFNPKAAHGLFFVMSDSEETVYAHDPTEEFMKYVGSQLRCVKWE